MMCGEKQWRVKAERGRSYIGVSNVVLSVCTHYKTINVGTVRPTALSLLSATSRSLATKSKSAHSLTPTHCSFQRQIQWTPRHEPPLLPSQAARQPRQLTQLSASSTGTSYNHPLFVAADSIPSLSAVYISLSPFNCYSLPIHPVRPQRTASQQLAFSPICWCISPHYSGRATLQFNPASCYQRAAWTTSHCSSLAHMPR